MIDRGAGLREGCEPRKGLSLFLRLSGFGRMMSGSSGSKPSSLSPLPGARSAAVISAARSGIVDYFDGHDARAQGLSTNLPFTPTTVSFEMASGGM